MNKLPSEKPVRKQALKLLLLNNFIPIRIRPEIRGSILHQLCI